MLNVSVRFTAKKKIATDNPFPSRSDSVYLPNPTVKLYMIMKTQQNYNVKYLLFYTTALVSLTLHRLCKYRVVR